MTIGGLAKLAGIGVAPSKEAIEKMIATAKGPGEGKRPALKGAFTAAPAIGVALLPKLTCPVCGDAIELVNRIVCPSCDVTVLDMRDTATAERAKEIGVRSVPAVAVNGTLADCCAGRGVDESGLRASGVGQPL